MAYAENLSDSPRKILSLKVVAREHVRMPTEKRVIRPMLRY